MPFAKEGRRNAASGETSVDVDELRKRLAELKQRKVAPAEVRFLMHDVEELKGKLQLTSTELDHINWPRKEVDELRQVLCLLDQWDELLKDVKQRLTSPSELIEDEWVETRFFCAKTRPENHISTQENRPFRGIKQFKPG